MDFSSLFENIGSMNSS